MAAAPKKKKPKKRVCRTVVDRRTRKRKKVCKAPAKRKRTAKRKPTTKRPAAPVVALPVVAQPGQPAPSPAAPPPTTGRPGPQQPDQQPDGKPDQQPPPEGLPRQQTFGAREAERLLWRAGFGPKPGEVAEFAEFAALTVEQAVHRLTRPAGTEQFVGAAPVDANGLPYNDQRAHSEYGADVIWLFDRMLRSTWPLAQRMALIWHDWFAVADRQMIGQKRMFAQHRLFLKNWLGNFRRLALDVTVDHAMLLFLNGIDNRAGAPNENYGRELMELFTLGADRGAYTETDVRELARVLTGYFAEFDGRVNDYAGWGFYPERHDAGSKTLWAGKPHARTGTFGWTKRGEVWECDAVDLCLQNPFHPSFFVRKLWSYFIPSAPPAGTQAALEKLYVDGGYEIRPLVEAILMHPDLYADRRMVKPPAVYIAGLMRARRRTIQHTGFDGVLEIAGQRLLNPPDVAGWRDEAWLDTSTLIGRAEAVSMVMNGQVEPVDEHYPLAETPEQAVAKALAYWQNPGITAATRAVLDDFARTSVNDAVLSPVDRSRYRAQRQNALRYLLAMSPDLQTS